MNCSGQVASNCSPLETQLRTTVIQVVSLHAAPMRSVFYRIDEIVGTLTNMVPTNLSIVIDNTGPSEQRADTRPNRESFLTVPFTPADAIVSMDATNITLLDVISNISEVCGLIYQFQSNKVVFITKDHRM